MPRRAATATAAPAVNGRPTRAARAVAAPPAPPVAEPKPAKGRKRQVDDEVTTPAVNGIAKKAKRTVTPAAPKPTFNALSKPDPLRHLIPDDKHLEVFCFGQNSSGELGMPEIEDAATVPKKHTWFSEKTEDEELGPRGLEDIVMGGMHSLALASDEKIYSWGVNDEAALGRPTRDEENAEPGQVTVPSKARINQISASDNATLFLDATGALYACGTYRGESGPMGLFNSKTLREPTPVLAEAMIPHPVVQVASGSNHGLALTVEGFVYSWGNFGASELGRATTERRAGAGHLTPRPVSNLRKIVAIWCGSSHSFALEEGGRLFGWGLNAVNQLALVRADGRRDKDGVVPLPRHLSFFDPDSIGSPIKQIAGGAHHSLFLLEDGRVFVSGRFTSGQLGLGDNSDAIRPIRASAIDRREFIKDAIAAEARRRREDRLDEEMDKPENERAPAHVFDALTFDMPDFVAQLNKDQPPVLEAIALPTLLTFGKGNENIRIVWVSATQDRSMAVDSRGRVWTWGSNENAGGIGLGAALEQIDVPTEIVKFRTSGIVAIKAEAGGQSSFVLGYRVPKPAAE